MKCKLNDVASVTKLAGFEFTKYIKYIPDGEIIAVRALNLKGGTLLLDDVRRISNDVSKSLERSKLCKNDIVLSYTGTIGECAQITENNKYHLAPNVCKITPNVDKVNPDFLFQYVRSPLFKQTMLNYCHGSTQPTIPMATIRELPINIPLDILKQSKVAHILMCFDKKIATNTAINKNLESQAKAIVKAYFIDFIPYGGTAPQGWSMVSLNDICEKITDGSHYSPVDSPEAPYPMYSVKDMRAYGFDPSSCKHITAEELQKMKQNDCVPQLDDILVAKDGSYLKEIFICSATRNEAILSSIAIFRPNRNMIEPEILLYFLKQPSIRKDVGENYVSGSALPRIVLKDFKKYPMLLPPIDEQHKISDLLHSYRMQIQSNVDEIDRLQTIRDTLLPRLMSGEIDVEKVEI